MVLSPCDLAFEYVACHHFLAAITPYAVTFVVAGVGRRGRCSPSRADQKVPQVLWSSISYQGGLVSAFWRHAGWAGVF